MSTVQALYDRSNKAAQHAAKPRMGGKLLAIENEKKRKKAEYVPFTLKDIKTGIKAMFESPDKYIARKMRSKGK